MKSAASGNGPEPLRVVIVGAGLPAAMAAAVLGRALPPPLYSIALVNPPTGEAGSPAIGLVETSLPSVRRFHADLDLPEEQLIMAAYASYSLGTGYAGWSNAAAAYFAPFGDIGAPLDGIAFHQLVHRLRARRPKVRLGNYSIAALLAQAGRFARPTDDDRSVLSTYSYGLHLDSLAYGEILLSIAETAGVPRATASYVGTELADDGSIAAVVVDGGQRLAADFVIDAAAPGSGPMTQLPGAEFESWRSWLPCDRTVEARSVTGAPPPPHSLVEAHSWGWRRSVPAIGQTGEYVAYSSDGMTDQEAVDMLRAAQGSAPTFGDLHAGRMKQPWLRNCVGLGSASAMLEPLASTSLHLLQSALGRLVTLFPTARESAVEAREYNRLTCQELDRTRDFAILRYKLNGRSGESFWDRLRDMTVPAELAHKIEQYRKRGRVPLLDGDIFEESDWALLFDEHGVRPERHDALADAIPIDQLEKQFERMRQVMNRAVSAVPYYSDYLTAIRGRNPQ